jgi:hypothetical protein
MRNIRSNGVVFLDCASDRLRYCHPRQVMATARRDRSPKMGKISMGSEIPNVMAAVQLIGHGGIEMLRYRDDVPTPVPQAGEV